MARGHFQAWLAQRERIRLRMTTPIIPDHRTMTGVLNSGQVLNVYRGGKKAFDLVIKGNARIPYTVDSGLSVVLE